jgi:hypothetical protein
MLTQGVIMPPQYHVADNLGARGVASVIWVVVCGSTGAKASKPNQARTPTPAIPRVLLQRRQWQQPAQPHAAQQEAHPCDLKELHQKGWVVPLLRGTGTRPHSLASHLLQHHKALSKEGPTGLFCSGEGGRLRDYLTFLRIPQNSEPQKERPKKCCTEAPSPFLSSIISKAASHTGCSGLLASTPLLTAAPG